MQHGQRRLHAGDASPRGSEVARLERRLRRRVIGCDDVDMAVQQLGPQSASAIAADAEGRRALRDGAEPLHVLLGEEQVMRTRLDRDVDTPRLRFKCQRDAAARADMHDVQRRARFARKRAARAGSRRARRSPGARPESRERRGRSRCAAELPGQFLALGMHRHRQSDAGRLAHPLVQRRDRPPAETRAARSRT